MRLDPEEDREPTKAKHSTTGEKISAPPFMARASWPEIIRATVRFRSGGKINPVRLYLVAFICGLLPQERALDFLEWHLRDVPLRPR